MATLDAICCTLTPQQQRARRTTVRSTIVPHVTAVTSLDDGLRLEFAVQEGVRELVEEFILLEEGCCSFLTFTLSPSGEELSLRIQGPPDAAHVIEMFRRTVQGES